MKTHRFDSLAVCQHPDRATLGASAAQCVARAIGSAIATRGEARVIFACAPSQDEFLAALAALPIEWGHVVIFHMDEYAGLPDTHPASFRSYLREHLLAHIAAPRVVHFIHAEAPSDRLLMGSDWPFYHQATTLAKTLIATENAPKVRAGMLRDNARRLFLSMPRS